MSEQLSGGTSEQPQVPGDEPPPGERPDSLGASSAVEGVDFAVLAYREEGTWQLEELDDDVLDDDDLYPDEFLSAIAARLGFGEPFDEFVGLAER